METTASQPVTPPAPPVKALDAATLCEAFQLTASERADAVALRTPDDSVSMTFAEYAERVRSIAAGLAALGVGRGDSVGIMLANRPEFHLVDTAALHLGATPFSVYNTSSPEQVEYLFGNAGNRVVVTERQFLPVVRSAQKQGELLEWIVVVDANERGAVSLANVELMGDPSFDFEAAWRAVEPGDVLTLIYTSGTTGPPKGVELTHASMLAEIRAVQLRLPMAPGGRLVSYLPSAHVADRWSAHYHGSMCLGFTVTSVAEIQAMVPTLPQVRPTVFGAVPRVWEKMKAALEAGGISDPSALPDEAKAAVRAKLGLDEVKVLVGGAAPVPPDVLRYFMELGLPISELWGMSELSCIATCNPLDDIRIGTVGTALPGVELKLEPDGELLARGPILMRGYRNDPERTAEAVDEDGWLHTGDIAEIDDDGYVKIVDRKKELIINAAGKNMSPANIEGRLKAAHPLIGQAVAIGDRRPYNVALIVLDPDVGAAFAAEHGIEPATIEALATNEAVRDAIAEAVKRANREMSRVEQIKRFAILTSEWLPGGDELTPTMKLKRKPIAEKYAAEIDALYAAAR